MSVREPFRPGRAHPRSAPGRLCRGLRGIGLCCPLGTVYAVPPWSTSRQLSHSPPWQHAGACCSPSSARTGWQEKLDLASAGTITRPLNLGASMVVIPRGKRATTQQYSKRRCRSALLTGTNHPKRAVAVRASGVWPGDCGVGGGEVEEPRASTVGSAILAQDISEPASPPSDRRTAAPAQIRRSAWLGEVPSF